MKMKELKQSETTSIKRSQINLNPYNPKIHSDDAVKKQLRNFKKNGFNGGIKWNVTTGNLIDGHRRTKALDLFHKYDGTVKTDYDVKVEKVELTVKAEKEQMTYEAIGNTRANYDLIAEYLPEIDYTKIGLSDEDINILSTYEVDEIIPNFDTIDDFIAPQQEIELKTTEPTPEEKKAAVKEMKQNIKDKALERQKDEEAYVTLSFSNHDVKAAFCEVLGLDPDEKFIKGEDILRMIE